MLNITKKQISIFQVHLRKEFEKDAVIHLRKTFPLTSTKYHDMELKKLVSEGVDKAAVYGITKRKEVNSYLEYVLCFGADFETSDTDVWVKRTLKNASISAAEKINRLQTIKPINAETK